MQPDKYPKAHVSLGFLVSSTGNRVAELHRDRYGRLLALKRIDPRRHMLRNPVGIAMDARALAEARSIGVEYVLVEMTTTNLKLWATLDDFDSQGFTFNRGYGLQRGLVLERWHRSPEPPQPAAPNLRVVNGGLFDDDQEEAA